MKTLTVCIPTHEMAGLGHIFLKKSLDALAAQTFEDFDVVVSDHSRDDKIYSLCVQYEHKLAIQYHRNSHGIGSSSANVNNAISHAGGRLIKILFLDDFPYNNSSLDDIVSHFDLERDHWLVTGCEHTQDGETLYRPFYPRYTRRIYSGNNTIGCPSVLTIRNEGHLLFDETLVWLMDVDYYKRCYDRFGPPSVLNKINVVIRVGEHQGAGGYSKEDRRATEQLKEAEYIQVLNKYEHGIASWRRRCTGFIERLLRQ